MSDIPISVVPFEPDIMTVASVPSDVDVADGLRKSVKILERYGWVQGMYGSQRTGYCVVGAISVASNSTTLELATLNKFYLWMLANGFFPSLADWNDAPGRTKDEVILYMTKCADEIDPGIK